MLNTDVESKRTVYLFTGWHQNGWMGLPARERGSECVYFAIYSLVRLYISLNTPSNLPTSEVTAGWQNEFKNEMLWKFLDAV